MHIRFSVNVAFFIVRCTEYNDYTTKCAHLRDVGDLQVRSFKSPNSYPIP